MDKWDKTAHYDRQNELKEQWSWLWRAAWSRDERGTKPLPKHLKEQLSIDDSERLEYWRDRRAMPWFGRISGYRRKTFVTVARSPCAVCKEPFYSQRRSAKYCSWECRRKARSVQARERGDQRVLREGEVWSIECDGCGEQFEARRQDAQTCSERCRKRVQRLGLTRRSERRDSPGKPGIL